MANRNLYQSTINQVTQVVPDGDGSGMSAAADIMQGLADVTYKNFQDSQTSKIAENFSQMQLDLGQVELEYKTKYELNPNEGVRKYKEAREKLIQKYGEGISPMFRAQWNERVDAFTRSGDAMQDKWAFTQTRKNNIDSANRAIKNSLKQAMNDGMLAGQSGDPTEAITNYLNSASSLKSSLTSMVGEASANKIMEDYDSDHVKSMLSGMLDSNPIEASRLMDNDKIKNAFTDPSQYMKMKDAINSRVMNMGKIAREQEIIGILKDENNILSQSVERQLSYSELEEALSKGDYSNAAKSYFYKLNGFKASGDGEAKLSSSEKMKFATDLYEDIVMFQMEENPSSEMVAALQEKVYAGMDNKSLSLEKGSAYLKQILAPAASRREEMLMKFDIGEKSKLGTEATTNRLFGRDHGLGFSGLEEVVNDITLPLQLKKDGTPYKSAENDRAEIFNNQKKLELYDYYYDELEKAASDRGIQIGDLDHLPRGERREVYQKAQNEAKFNFWSSQYPNAGFNKENPPSSVVTSDGRKIKTGLSNGNATSSVDIMTKVMTDGKGNKAIVEVDASGKPVRVIRKID